MCDATIIRNAYYYRRPFSIMSQKSLTKTSQNLTKKAFKAMEGMEDYSPPDLMGIYFQYTRRE